VVTVIFTVVPPDPAGATTEIEVGLTTEKFVAEVDPNLTEVAPVKFVPVIVTFAPPAANP
jgi:hypothetical protein